MRNATRLGLIARMDKSGLGQGQTLRLARLLKPDYIMLIDSTMFNGAEQHPEWYREYEADIIKGFPTFNEIESFLDKVDIVISCETFYNNQFTDIAKAKGAKTVLIANPEFFDWFTPSFDLMPPPDKVIIPSRWMQDDMMNKFNATYLPTPIFKYEFESAYKKNLNRKPGKPRYLFMNGKTAAEDRNGLASMYEAVQLARTDFELVVKAQGEMQRHPDPRITYDFSNPDNQADLYTEFDAMFLPRRYAGQCLPMTEALLSGLPVVMTDVDPNNKILPQEWLVEATEIKRLMTRISIPVYDASPVDLMRKLETLDVSSEAKLKARTIGEQYLADNLKEDYQYILRDLV